MLNWLKDPLHALQEFVQISTLLSKESDLKQLLSMLLSTARRLSAADAGVFYILDNTKQYLHAIECQCDSTPFQCKYFPVIPLYDRDQRNIEDFSAYCAFTGKCLNIDNIYRYTGFDQSKYFELDQTLGYRTQSLLAVPMQNHEGYILGVLHLINMTDKENGTFTSFPKEIEGIISAVASQAAVAVDNARLMRKNKELIEILNSTNKRLEEENKLLRSKIQARYDFSQIIGSSPAMQNVFDLMSRVMQSDATVLIRGETGTGKELIANAIHYNSPRRDGQFVPQNCAALPESLLESELFGYKKGAFSGANTDKAGLIELAHGGTLFLDEIGDMPIGLQAKLLRVIQEKEVRPLGAVESKRVNVRIVAATHCNLEEKIKEGEFREDLFYRLSVYPIDIPPLRDRKEDYPALLQHFLENFSKMYEKSIAGFAPQALDLLAQFDYPGNIRQMRNIVERAVLLCVKQGNILPEHLPEFLQEVAHLDRSHLQAIPRNIMNVNTSGTLKDIMEEYEAEAIRQALEDCNWNQTKTAASLGIGRRTLISKMNRYQIERRPNVEA